MPTRVKFNAKHLADPLQDLPDHIKVFRVGGVVRDQLLGLSGEDVDWVVVGSNPSTMIEMGFKPVGMDFPVFLHPHTGEEYALARTERKQGQGYQGFVFHADSTITLEQDLIRRDLTINAMAMAQDGTLIDPYGGQADIQAKVLRHVSAAFSEDPLRVLRVARFYARLAHLGFKIATDTLNLMSDMVQAGELITLTPERVWQELSRGLMAPSPMAFLQALRDCGALKVCLPEVDALFGVPQSPQYHPEIDTGDHVMRVLEQCARFHQPLPVRWAGLLHDVGKALTPPEQWPKHHEHERLGKAPIHAINQRYKVPSACAEVAILVGEHHLLVHQAQTLRPATLLRLLQKLDAMRRPERFELCLVACEMDARGRLGLEDNPYPSAQYLRDAQALVKAVSPAPFLDKGLSGAELGQKLIAAQEAVLTEYKMNGRVNHPSI